MKRILSVTFIVMLAATAVLAQAPKDSSNKWLHVRVEKSGEDGEFVRVNIPLSLAEAVLPAINSHNLRHGRVRIHNHNDIDLRAILEAVRNTKDGEFVTIDKKDETIRVTKSGGYLLVKIDKSEKDGEKVDVKIPLVVVDALLSGGENELNILAAIKALREFGDIELVSVRDGNETVRIWIDSKNTGE